MIKRSGQTLSVLFLLCDLTITALVWVGAYILRFDSGWFPITRDVPPFSLYVSKLPLVVILAAVGYRMGGLYAVHRLRRFREEVIAVARGVGLMSLLVMSTTFFLQDHYESRGVMLLFSGLAAGAMISARRIAWNTIRRLRRRGYNQSHAVIIGTGRTARKTARALRHASGTGIRNIGYIEDNPNRWCSDLNVLGGIRDLPRLVEEYQIHHVFIAIPMSRFHEARKVFDVLSQHLVEIRLVADLPNLAGFSLTTTTLDGLPVIGLRESPHFGLNVVVKRIMDLTLATLALIVLSPVMLLVALLIRVTSPGPIFFRQERCGLNGTTFSMIKFRSMKVNAEKESGPVMAQENDPRRTRLGAFLRKTSIDELPQLFNVIRGDMSLVGPRPERPNFIEQFSKTIPNYMVRHSVKAGITGWAQVNGYRGNTSLRKRIQFDLYYITHWNPWFDIRILWLTVVSVLFHRHAY